MIEETIHTASRDGIKTYASPATGCYTLGELPGYDLSPFPSLPLFRQTWPQLIANESKGQHMPTTDTYTITATADLPVIGTRTFTLKETLTGLEDAAAQEVLSLDGGTFAGSVSVSKSADGVDIKASINLPIVGVKTLDLDEPLHGLEATVVDELLALHGNTLSLAFSVVKA